MVDYNIHRVFQPISIQEMGFLGTSSFTFTMGANGVPFMQKINNADTTELKIPIMLPFIVGQHGVKLNALHLPMRVGTTDLTTAITATLWRNNYYLAVTTPSAATEQTATSIPITLTGGQVTAGSGSRLLLATVDTPIWVHTDTVSKVGYHLAVTIAADTTSNVRIYDAIADYDTYL